MDSLHDIFFLFSLLFVSGFFLFFFFVCVCVCVFSETKACVLILLVLFSPKKTFGGE